ncbi:hypothetical protein MIDIC_340033 [Alphaproteobacteria bacterium]
MRISRQNLVPDAGFTDPYHLIGKLTPPSNVSTPFLQLYQFQLVPELFLHKQYQHYR